MLHPIQCGAKDCTKMLQVETGAKDLKCADCGTVSTVTWPDPVEAAEKHDHIDTWAQPRSMGGATSFADADEFDEARKQENWVRDQEFTFSQLFNNIMAQEDVSLGNKVRQVASIAAEMGSRIQTPDLGDNKATPTLWDRVKEMLGMMAAGDPRERPLDAHDGEPAHDAHADADAHDDAHDDHNAPKRGAAFWVTKGIDGVARWVALTTNKFEDREGEQFSEESHKEFVKWVDETKRYPELRLWHMPGSGIGAADIVSYADGFLLESGTFTDQRYAKALADMGELGVSHGYAYRKEDLDKDGTYHRYRQFELTVLPPESAANLWTAFLPDASIKEVTETMAMDPEKRKFLVQVLGEERTAAIEEGVETLSKTLEASGVGWKDLSKDLGALDADPKPAADTEGDEKPKADATPSATPDAPTATPTPDGGDVASELKGIKEGLQVMSKGLDEQFESIEKRLASLEETDDAKISKALTPKATANGAQRPSQSAENTGDAADKAAAALPKADDPPGGDNEEGTKDGNPARAFVNDMLAGKTT